MTIPPIRSGWNAMDASRLMGSVPGSRTRSATAQRRPRRPMPIPGIDRDNPRRGDLSGGGPQLDLDRQQIAEQPVPQRRLDPVEVVFDPWRRAVPLPLDRFRILRRWPRCALGQWHPATRRGWISHRATRLSTLLRPFSDRNVSGSPSWLPGLGRLRQCRLGLHQHNGPNPQKRWSRASRHRSTSRRAFRAAR